MQQHMCMHMHMHMTPTAALCMHDHGLPLCTVS